MDQKTYNKLKQEIEELKDLPGQQRGEHIKYFVNYVRRNYGEEKLQEIKDTLKKMDFDIGDVENLSDTEYISETIPHVFFVAAARICGWSEEEIFQMGKEVVLQSTITKVFIKYFSSLRKTLERGVQQWNKNFSRGKMELKKLDTKKKKGSLVLKNFYTHPLACVHFQGFFTRILELGTGRKQVNIKESKCMSRGDDYHQFDFEWK